MKRTRLLDCRQTVLSSHPAVLTSSTRGVGQLATYRPALPAHEWMAAGYISHRPPLPPPPSAASCYSSVARRGAAGVDPMTNRQPTSQSGGVRPVAPTCVSHSSRELTACGAFHGLRTKSCLAVDSACGTCVSLDFTQSHYSNHDKWCCFFKISVSLTFLEDKKKIQERDQQLCYGI